MNMNKSLREKFNKLTFLCVQLLPSFCCSPLKPKRNSNLAQITVQVKTWLWFPKRKILHMAQRRRWCTSPLQSAAHSLPPAAPSLDSFSSARGCFSLRGLAHAGLGSLSPSPSLSQTFFSSQIRLYFYTVAFLTVIPRI